MNPPREMTKPGEDEESQKEQLERSWVQRALAAYTAQHGGVGTPPGTFETHQSEEEDRKPAATPNPPVASTNTSQAHDDAAEEDGQSTLSQSSSSSTTSSIDSRALQELAEAIDLLPEEENKEYQRVKKEKPHLIERDSNPVWFLHHCKFDQWQAAKKLACYWKERFRWFQERALLPMTQTGDGCLSKQDVSMLKTGFYAAVSHDDSGRTVFVSDAFRRKKKDHPSIMRVHFYMNHIFMQNPLTARKGITLVIVLSKASLDLAGQHAQDRIEVAKRAFPHGVHSVHIICRNDFANPLQTFLDDAIPFLFKMFKSLNKNKHFHRRTNISQQAFLDKLKENHGLSRSNLPDCIGGEWTSAHFAEWRERQIRVEWDLPLGDLGGEDAGDNEQEAVGSRVQLTAEEKKERKRKYNVLHSRRKRLRLKREKDTLRTQIQGLELEQKALKSEGMRLETLLRRATETVKTHLQEQGMDANLERTAGVSTASSRLASSTPSRHKQILVDSVARTGGSQVVVGGTSSASGTVPLPLDLDYSTLNNASTVGLSSMLFQQQQQEQRQWLHGPFSGNAHQLPASTRGPLMPPTLVQQSLFSQPVWLSNLALEQQRQQQQELLLRQNLSAVPASSTFQGVIRQGVGGISSNLSSSAGSLLHQSTRDHDYGSDQRRKDPPPPSLQRKRT